MWTKKILSLLFIALTLLALITSCATTGDKNPLRYEPENHSLATDRTQSHRVGSHSRKTPLTPEV